MTPLFLYVFWSVICIKVFYHINEFFFGFFFTSAYPFKANLAYTQIGIHVKIILVTTYKFIRNILKDAFSVACHKFPAQIPEDILFKQNKENIGVFIVQRYDIVFVLT